MVNAPSALLRPTSRRLAVLAAVGVILAVLGVRLMPGASLSGASAFLLLIPAVVAGAALGGWTCGLLATLLGLVAGVALSPHAPNVVAEAAFFAAAAAAITTGGEGFQRALRDLSARETHLRLILNTVPDAMILIDEKGAMRAFSPAAERLFGWTEAEALGRNVSILMPSPHREAHDAYLRRYYRTGERRIIGLGRIVNGERRDGSTFPMELAVGEMRTSEGRFFTGFVRDITERQEAEAHSQQLQNDLVRVSRLTALGEMASALAHELNQPLTAITNYLRGSRRLLDARGMTDDRVAVAVAAAADQALRAGLIIRRLREFVARGETERRIEDLGRLIEEAAGLALVGAHEAGVQVRFEIDPDLGRVVADKIQIQQVLLNLIRNAIDAMEDAPRRALVIAASRLDAEQVRIAVSDTGPGIAEDLAGQLFQPFVTSKRTGMGVGLSISRTIVETHGGRIGFESEPGAGTTFFFTLQRAGLEEETPDGP